MREPRAVQPYSAPNFDSHASVTSIIQKQTLRSLKMSAYVAGTSRECKARCSRLFQEEGLYAKGGAV
jgi:hypothetical protein